MMDTAKFVALLNDLTEVAAGYLETQTVATRKALPVWVEPMQDRKAVKEQFRRVLEDFGIMPSSKYQGPDAVVEDVLEELGDALRSLRFIQAASITAMGFEGKTLTSAQAYALKLQQLQVRAEMTIQRSREARNAV